MELRPDLWTVGRLKKELSGYPDDWEVDPSGLDFYKVVPYGHGLVQIEFNQAVYRNKEGNVVVNNPA